MHKPNNNNNNNNNKMPVCQISLKVNRQSVVSWWGTLKSTLVSLGSVGSLDVLALP